MSLKNIIEKLATVKGVKADESIQALLSNEELAKIEVDEELESKLISDIFTKESALNNRDIKDHFYKEINDGIYRNVDDVTKSQLEAFGIEGEARDSMLNAESPLKRLKLLFETIKNKEPKKSDNNAQLETLHNKIKEMESQHSEKLKSIEQERMNEKINNIFSTGINSKPLIDNIPGGKEFLIEAITNKARKNYALNLDDKGISFRNREDASLKAYEENNEVTLDGYLKKELEPYIKKSDGNPTPTTEPKRVQTERKGPMTHQERVKYSGVRTSL
jgi:hypothetical protein